MDFAIRTLDNVLVFAEDYLDTEESPYGFICPYDRCGTEMRLKSYTKKNKRTPYFAPRYPIEKPHTEYCITRRKKYKEKTNGINKSIPIPYKNKLLFEDDNCCQETSINKMVSSEDKDKTSGDKKLYHNRTAKHIASIVRWYLQNPNSGNSSLEVPDCKYNNYKSIFQRINFDPQKKYKGTHIFFGSLLIRKAFEEKEGKIIFYLFQNKYNEPLKLIVETNGWKESAIKFLKGITDKAVKESREDYNKNSQKRETANKRVYPYLFFLGRVDEVSRRLFYCNRHQACFVIAIEDLKLYSENHGIYNEPKAPIKQNIKSNNKNVLTENLNQKTEVTDNNFSKEPPLNILKNRIQNIDQHNHIEKKQQQKPPAPPLNHSKSKPDRKKTKSSLVKKSLDFIKKLFN